MENGHEVGMRVGVEGTVDMLVRGEKINRPTPYVSEATCCNFFFNSKSAFLWHSVRASDYQDYQDVGPKVGPGLTVLLPRFFHWHFIFHFENYALFFWKRVVPIEDAYRYGTVGFTYGHPIAGPIVFTVLLFWSLQ